MSAVKLNDLHDKDEERTVIRWRIAALREAGYDWSAAMILAVHRDVDLHAARDLVARGCPVDTALRILL